MLPGLECVIIVRNLFPTASFTAQAVSGEHIMETKYKISCLVKLTRSRNLNGKFPGAQEMSVYFNTIFRLDLLENPSGNFYVYGWPLIYIPYVRMSPFKTAEKEKNTLVKHVSGEYTRLLIHTHR
jgi:hypothetical protein